MSKRLSEKISKHTPLSTDDIHVIKVSVYEDDELLREFYHYLLRSEAIDRGIGPGEYIIKSEGDEELLDQKLGDIMKGGGCCAECLKDLMKRLGLSIDKLIPRPNE